MLPLTATASRISAWALRVLGIEGLFLFRELPPPLFQRVHLWELCPIQKLTHGGLCRPVVRKLRLVLGQIFFRIPGRLVAVKHGPCLCVLHHRPHELGSMGEGGLGVPQLPGQGVKAIHRRLGAGRKRLVIGKPMLPEIQECGGHLFEVINFGPPLVGRAFALGQTVLNVDDEIDAPGRGRALLWQLRDRALTPAITARMSSGSKPGAQSGRAQAGRLILPRGQE